MYHSFISGSIEFGVAKYQMPVPSVVFSQGMRNDAKHVNLADCG